MKLNKEEKKILDDYLKEMDERKRLSKKEIENLINEIQNDPYTSYRTLIQSHLYYAYDIAKKYEVEELTILDLIHAANEGLEIGVTSNKYKDYDSFINKIDKAIKDSINLVLSYL